PGPRGGVQGGARGLPSPSPQPEVLPAVRAGRRRPAAVVEPRDDLQAELLHRHHGEVPRPQAQGVRLPQVAGAARAVAGRHRRHPPDGGEPRPRDQRGGGRSVRVPPVRALMTWFSSWPEPGGKGLDPKVSLALSVQGAAPDYRSQGPALVRTNFNQLAAKVPKPDEPLASVENGRADAGVPIRIYTPQGKGPFPICLYFHGGGWVVGDLESHDHVCRSLARRGNAVVVNVDYRLAPETKFPGALDD